MFYQTAVLLFAFIIGLSAVEVTFKGDWKTGAGWEMVCSWRFPSGDRLQSVHMYRGSAQFKIYRPELSGPSLLEEFNTTDSLMRLECTAHEQQYGSCVLTVSPHTPPASITIYACEVSGEWPRFRMQRREYELEAFVPSTDAQISAQNQLEKSTGAPLVLLNCSATGIPAPTLAWSVGKQAMQADFSGRAWNLTTRLMHAWSTLTLPPAPARTFRCVPEQRTYRRSLALGPPAEYLLQPPPVQANTAGCTYNNVSNIVIITVLFFLMR